MNRATCKLILACTLLVAAAFLPSSAQAAGTCCTNCYNTYLVGCWNSCNGDATCQNTCESKYDNCAIGCSRFGQNCPI
jgi:hypothetical protein